MIRIIVRKEDKGSSKAKDAAKKKGSNKKKFHISNEFSNSKKSLFLTLQEIRIEYLKIRRMFSLAAPIDEEPSVNTKPELEFDFFRSQILSCITKLNHLIEQANSDQKKVSGTAASPGYL